MATLREVKNRIRSVRNITQITRALEAVSASRVRRAQARVLASRAYAEKAWEILINIQAASKNLPLHPLLAEREEINKVMVVVITSDRGLAGAYNTNVLRVAQRFATRLGKPVEYVAVGRKARDSLVRSGANIVASFTDLSAAPKIADITPICCTTRRVKPRLRRKSWILSGGQTPCSSRLTAPARRFWTAMTRTDNGWMREPRQRSYSITNPVCRRRQALT